MQRQSSFKNYRYKDLRTYSFGKGPLASALCYTQDGDLIGSTSCYRYSHFEGKIFILDPNTLYASKTMTDRPANALCSNPDGTLFVGTCDYSSELGYVIGAIDILCPTGDFIKTLIDEPASSLCYRPDGMLLVGTCYYSLAHFSVEGSIVIRDPSSGKKIKTLIEEPASAICYLPDGTLLTSTCYSSNRKRLEGRIVMRDSATGQMIRTLQEHPASAMCFTPTHGLLKSAFWNNVPIGIGVSTTHWAPNKELYYKSRQTFIDTVIEIANAYYSPIRNKAKYHLSIFPQEILFMIILEYGKIALGMNNNDVFKCFKLILQNFEIRRYLITQGKYVPTAEVTRDSVLNAGEGIWKWWSQTTHDKSQEKIFRTSFHTTLFKPSIREKEPLSKPAKEEHSHQKKYRKRCLLM